MVKVKNPELFMTTAGGRIKCCRCIGLSSRTQKQCRHPALKTSKQSRCKWHGGASTGPRTKEGIERIREAHWKHGELSKEAIRIASENDAMFRYLTDIGNHINLFTNKVKSIGRPSSLYEKLDLTDPMQLIEAIARTIRKT
jgi:hypothetical protein